MKILESCLLRWINDKGYSSQSYGKNHKMPEIAILVDNCGGQRNINCGNYPFYINMIKDGGFFGTATFHLYIKVNTNNDCDCAFNSLNMMYWKKCIFTFEKFCEVWIPEIMLNLFYCSMKTSLTCNHSGMISLAYLILKL